MDAETVGLTGSDLVLGKHSGRHALRRRLRGPGLRRWTATRSRGPSPASRRSAEPQVAGHHARPRGDRGRGAATRGRETTATASPRSSCRPAPAARPGRASRSSRVADEEAPALGTAEGDGPIDAAVGVDAASAARGVELSEDEIQAVTGGADALGEARVRGSTPPAAASAGRPLPPTSPRPRCRRFLRACSAADRRR